MSHVARFPGSLFCAFLLLSLALGCGGGGGASASVKGTLTDGFGAVINRSDAVVSLEGTDSICHPDSKGAFSLAASPGTYVLRGVWADPAAGIRLEGKSNVTLTKGRTANIGLFAISDSSLDSGWAYYRQGKYYAAESAFQQYLTNARSGQASLGGSSALCGLGWTRGRGLDDPVKAAGDFEEAIDAWDGNVDAWVGLAACELGRMKSDGGLHLNQAAEAINKAIDLEGEYTSAPTHDQISEIDLRAYRAYINFLNGNVSAARSEAQAIQSEVATSGSRASANAIAIVLRFTG